MLTGPLTKGDWSGYAFLGGGAICWLVRSNDVLLIHNCVKIRGSLVSKFFQCLYVMARADETVTVDCDCMAALAYTKNPKYHGQTKQIDVWEHYIRDVVAQREVVIKYFLPLEWYQTYWPKLLLGMLFRVILKISNFVKFDYTWICYICTSCH